MPEEVEERLERYRRDGLAEVEGWFEPESAEVIASLLLHQVSRGLTGGIAEIGVHHGRSFLLLANGLTPGEPAVALDVFENQEQNADHSGRGDRVRFEANLERWAPSAPVQVVASSSLDVAVSQAQGVFGRPRMFSVDGGHTAEITRHDLLLAEASIGPGGVVVLDDMLNGHWLGVLTGTASYLLADPRLVPFALSPNKLYLTDSPEAAADYADHLRDALPDLLGKRDVEFFGTVIDVYGQGAPRHANGRPAGPAPEVRRARAAARSARREVADLAAQLAAVRTSTSWRATAPLRGLSKLVRR